MWKDYETETTTLERFKNQSTFTLSLYLSVLSNADKGKFVVQTDSTDNHKATAEIYFKAGPDYLKRVFGSDKNIGLKQ